MAITATVIDSGSGTSADPSVTANDITPTASRTILLGVLLNTTSRTVAGVTGCNLTWTQVDTDAVVTNWYVFRASGASPTLGKLSIDLSGGTSVTRYIIVECAGSDTTTTDGVVQSAKGTGTTSATATLSAFASSNNGVVAFAGSHNSSDIVAGSGYTELDQVDGLTTSIFAEWRADNDTSVDCSATSADDTGIIAMEIAATGAAFVPRTIVY